MLPTSTDHVRHAVSAVLSWTTEIPAAPVGATVFVLTVGLGGLDLTYPWIVWTLSLWWCSAQHIFLTFVDPMHCYILLLCLQVASLQLPTAAGQMPQCGRVREGTNEKQKCKQDEKIWTGWHMEPSSTSRREFFFFALFLEYSVMHGWCWLKACARTDWHSNRHCQTYSLRHVRGQEIREICVAFDL